jgi:cell division control protein 7
MATAAHLLSQHSSNPLEVHSSDARNSLYVRNYRRALVAHSQLSSEDAIGGTAAPELQEYHEHLKAVCNLPISASTSTMARVPPGFVDLDEDMDSEDAEADLVVKQEEQDDVEFEHDEDADSDVEIQDVEDATEQHVDTDHEEENSILLKPPDEQADIQTEIEDLERAVPRLSSDYKIVDRLGTGTFSSVYKAVDLGFHTKWHNPGGMTPSSYNPVSGKTDQSKKVFVAIKRIYVTSGPERIRNEISIMEDCRSCRHVSQLITAFRHKDQVVAIMPYHRNDDFRVSLLSVAFASIYIING